MEHRAVTYFRKYLRIPTVHPNVDYGECVSFLKRLAKENGLEFSIYGKPKKPFVILTWHGADNNLGSILLNSHMDVVPVSKERWTFDPFEAIKDEHGNVYGRGSQDCKCLGIQYVEAVRRLMEEHFQPLRTVHILFSPDEEIGGKDGMSYFVQTEDFRKLNPVFALDEGAPFHGDKYVIFNDERCLSHLKITCRGTSGHGSLLHKNTAGEKLATVLDELMNFRESQVNLLSKLPDPIFSLSQVTSINLTKLDGGVQNNVVPHELSMTLDVRLSVNSNHQEFHDWIQEICSTAGDGVSYELLEYSPKVPRTEVDETNPYWIAMKEVLDELNRDYTVMGCPGGTDARYLRKVALPALGFSPIRNTPIKLHADDEFLNEQVFLDGVNVYQHIIKSLVNVRIDC